MKKYGSTIQILSLACACLIVAGSATESGAAIAPPNSGHLLVYRAAKFGYRLNLVLSVDGKNVASLTEAKATMDTCRRATSLSLDYSEQHRCESRARNCDDTSWAELLLHGSFVGNALVLVRKN